MSNIDVTGIIETNPVQGNPTTASVRDNFAAIKTQLSTAKTELENLSGIADPVTARANLGLVIGTNVQAYDATLQSLSALGTAADKIPYTTAVDTWAETPLTSFARTLLDDATSNDALTTLTATRSEAGAVAVPVLNKLREVVSVQDFGAVGDYNGITGTDNAAAFQAAITYCGDNDKRLFVPAGNYLVLSTLSFVSTKPFRIYGEGLGVAQEHGSIITLGTASTNLFSLSLGSAYVMGEIEGLYITNDSGGSAETAFYSISPVYVRFRNVRVFGFEYAFEFQKSLFATFDSVFIDNCAYGISAYNINVTPPLQLNINYYNNLVAIRDCQITDCTVGIQAAGAIVQIHNTDVSRFASYGIKLGSSDLNSHSFTLDGLYFEGTPATAVPLYIENGIGQIGTVFFGQAFNTGISCKNSRVTISNAYNYGSTMAVLVANDGGRIFLDNSQGDITAPFSTTNSGVSFYSYIQRPQSGSVAVLGQGQSSTLSSVITGTGLWELTLRLDDNGTTRLQKYVIRTTDVRSVTTQDTPSVNLAVTSALNGGTGKYDITFTNTAGAPWNITIGNWTLLPLGMVY